MQDPNPLKWKDQPIGVKVGIVVVGAAALAVFAAVVVLLIVLLIAAMRWAW
jgi:hypothetical protein